MLALSNEQKDTAKQCFNKIHSYKQEMQGKQLHDATKQQCQTLLSLLPEDLAVNQTMLVSLIKTQQFDQAL